MRCTTDEGDLSQVVDDCVEGLGRCLAGSQDPSTREDILQALFDIYASDVDLGGVGMGDGVPDLVLEHASREERARVAGWIRERLPRREGFVTDWRRQTYGGSCWPCRMRKWTMKPTCRSAGRRIGCRTWWIAC